jgi:hypothetical protein
MSSIKKITTMKKIMMFIVLALICQLNPTKLVAQKSQNELVVTVGSGYSLSMAIVRGVINTSLRASGFNEVKTIPIINAQLDYAVADNFSMGVAYSFHKWSIDETRMINDTLYNAQVGLSRQNIGFRPLFHFGSDESLDLYAGGRLGYSVWSGNYAIRNNYGDNRADAVRTPSTFTVQFLFGVRKYFNDFIGINFEVGLGTAPYFMAGGLSFKI